MKSIDTLIRDSLLIAAHLIGLLSAPACAADSVEQSAIRQVLMQTFDKSDLRLQVEPIVVQGDTAVAGWTQGERGGRALLRRQGTHWQINACGGDGLKDAKSLVDTGLSQAQAEVLASRVSQAEAQLSPAKRAKFASFGSTQRMDGHASHGH